MTHDEMLIGWLCILRLNWENDVKTIRVPGSILRQLSDKGWVGAGPDVNGDRIVGLTTEGAMVTDLNCYEWGMKHTWVPEKS